MPEFTRLRHKLKEVLFSSVRISAITSFSEIKNWNAIASNGVRSSHAISMILSVWAAVKLNLIIILVIIDFHLFRFYIVH